MKVNGRLYTCDRCGETEFFKHITDKETDGGFTRWNEFEKANGWGNKSIQEDFLDLCPKCFEEYCEKLKQFETSFIGNSKK